MERGRPDMSLDVERELTEMASRARQYADATSVLRTVKRRRRRQLGSVALAAVVVLVALVGVSTQLRPTARPTPAAEAIVPDLPLVVDPPTDAAPVLPTDRGVGRSALVYQAAPNGPAYLVAPDGTQYRVPFTPLTRGEF